MENDINHKSKDYSAKQQLYNASSKDVEKLLSKFIEECEKTSKFYK